MPHPNVRNWFVKFEHRDTSQVVRFSAAASSGHQAIGFARARLRRHLKETGMRGAGSYRLYELTCYG